MGPLVALAESNGGDLSLITLSPTLVLVVKFVERFGSIRRKAT